MNTLIRSAFVLGLILALLVTGDAAGAEEPNPSQHTMHHHKRNFPKASALAERRAVVAPSAPMPETDGLSRHDEDCNTGCIDH
jgi:hypothetical protein